MLLNLPPGAFQDGFFFDAVMQVVGHHTAAAVAVGLGAEHAFFFDLTGGGEGVAFGLEDAMVGHLFGILRLHQFQDPLRHGDEVAVFFPLEPEQLVDHGIACLPADPEIVGETFDGGVEVEHETLEVGGGRPILQHLLDGVLIDRGDAHRRGDVEVLAAAIFFHELIKPRLAPHLFMGLFVAIDGDMEVGLGPVGERHGAVGDDQIVQEMFFAALDDPLLEQGLAADPGAAVQKSGFLLERQDAGLPRLGVHHAFLFLFKEIAVLAAQVALIRHVDRDEGALGKPDRHEKKLRDQVVFEEGLELVRRARLGRIG